MCIIGTISSWYWSIDDEGRMNLALNWKHPLNDHIDFQSDPVYDAESNMIFIGGYNAALTAIHMQTGMK